MRERTGLELDATFPATKLGWVLDHVDGARAAAEDGRLAYGDVAAWLLHRLAGVHVTDAGNAGRSLLCPLGGLDWDDELLELFRVPRGAAAAGRRLGRGSTPRSRASAVRAAAGDQQASLFGLRCWTAGTAKVTLGTGAFVLAQAGDVAARAAGRHPARRARGGARAPPATRSRASSRPPARRSTGSPGSARCPRGPSSTHCSRAPRARASSACRPCRASAARTGTRASAERCSG